MQHVTIYAHRGASDQFAEHTRAAYLQALAEGADGLECDVHLTRDQELVCIHDGTLDRTSSGSGDVADHTLQELRELDFSSWKGALIPAEFGGTADQLLTLDELIDLARTAERPLGLAIELKHPSPFGLRLEEEVLEFLLRQGWEPETSSLGNLTISFMSFNPASVRHLLEWGVADRFLCQLVADVDAEEVKEQLQFGALTAGAVLNLLRRTLNEGETLIDNGRAGLAGPGVEYVRAHRDRVVRWLAAGTRLRVWTVNSAADVELMRQLGVQEVTTNRPGAVRTQLESIPAPADSA